MAVRAMAMAAWCVFTLQACTTALLPSAHRHPMQQGNLIDLEQRAQLQVGMTQDQVRFLVGDPALSNLVQPNTWLYIYNSGELLEPGINHLLALAFDSEGTLLSIDNRYAPERAQSAFRRDTRRDFD
ncbi:MAG: outer membrane protein assembly factor BamE [Pseudomonadota bacterium]